MLAKISLLELNSMMFLEVSSMVGSSSLFPYSELCPVTSMVPSKQSVRSYIFKTCLECSYHIMRSISNESYDAKLYEKNSMCLRPLIAHMRTYGLDLKCLIVNNL